MIVHEQEGESNSSMVRWAWSPLFYCSFLSTLRAALSNAFTERVGLFVLARDISISYRLLVCCVCSRSHVRLYYAVRGHGLTPE